MEAAPNIWIGAYTICIHSTFVDSGIISRDSAVELRFRARQVGVALNGNIYCQRAVNMLDSFLSRAPVVPVVVIQNVRHAVPLAQALLAGGISVIEVTLRSDAALAAMTKIAQEVPQMMIAAGTVTTAAQMQAAQDAGAKVAISPGLSTPLLVAAKAIQMAWLPGIATASELLTAMDGGLRFCKLFPAAAVGGVALLQAFRGPFANMRFCPTGGISLAAAADYLALENVICVGASWVASAQQIEARDWSGITHNARQANALRVRA
jgi:2-dehydro-3-deoxyphosphogluconate aldolase / (4S)-4-hydroxy-2-oxoglutarate aldolase